MVNCKRMCTWFFHQVSHHQNQIKSVSWWNQCTVLSKLDENGMRSWLPWPHSATLHSSSFWPFLIHQENSFIIHYSIKYFFGLEVAHSKLGISLCQRKYWLDLLSDSGSISSKPLSTPSDPSIKLHNDSSPLYEDIPSYRSLVGKLLYLNITTPDIMFITQQLS